MVITQSLCPPFAQQPLAHCVPNDPTGDACVCIACQQTFAVSALPQVISVLVDDNRPADNVVLSVSQLNRIVRKRCVDMSRLVSQDIAEIPGVSLVVIATAVYFSVGIKMVAQ